MAPFFVLEEFKNYLHVEKRFSDHTFVAYVKDLEQFIEFAGIGSVDDLKEVSHQVVRGWIVSLIDAGVTGRSVNRKLSSLRLFFKWTLKQAILELDPMTRVRGPKTEKRLPEFARQHEVTNERTDEIFSHDFEGVRDRLMVEIFYQTGIRLSELIELRENNVTARSIKVVGKRNKERIIPISEDLFGLMEHYRDLKKQNDIQSACYFVLINGNKLYPRFVYRKINYYLGRVTNLDKKSPHVLRHTFATHMLNNGAGLETLKSILGHANLSATQVYTHNSFTQLNNIYSQAHPRGRKKN